MKVIIIDDEFWSRDSIRRLGDWERFGIDWIAEAEDGLTGLKIIDEAHPDIVITDMKMRGMDGVELLQKLNENYPFLRKIVISGYEDFSYMKQAIVSKVDEYILKPINPEELNHALEKAINQLQASKGLHSAQPIDKELLKLVMEYKNSILIFFHDFNIEALKDRFNELQQKIKLVSRLQPGTQNNLYKQFMLILEEQASLFGIELKHILSAQTSQLYVTDETPIEQWMQALSEAYESVIKEIMNQRKKKGRIDIQEVKLFIDNHYAEPIRLETISNQFFVSKEHLSRTFKQEIGSTVMDYIIMKRMEKAKQLLQDPNLQIKTVAEAVGYTDLNYFFRIFKKITGVTPSQIRHELQ
jgi:two-component system, response regulator YesN